MYQFISADVPDAEDVLPDLMARLDYSSEIINLDENVRYVDHPEIATLAHASGGFITMTRNFKAYFDGVKASTSAEMLHVFDNISEGYLERLALKPMHLDCATRLKTVNSNSYGGMHVRDVCTYRLIYVHEIHQSINCPEVYLLMDRVLLTAADGSEDYYMTREIRIVSNKQELDISKAFNDKCNADGLENEQVFWLFDKTLKRLAYC